MSQRRINGNSDVVTLVVVKTAGVTVVTGVLVSLSTVSRVVVVVSVVVPGESTPNVTSFVVHWTSADVAEVAERMAKRVAEDRKVFMISQRK